jgi:RHS repeat-associated protein
MVYKFEYNLQDHLGNTRVVFSGHSNGQPELMQVTDYYPFGLVMNQQDYFANGVLSNKYLYNNKELQDDELAGNSLGWYDYGARFYDAELGRWHSIDPMASDFPSWTPYHYVHNNPIILVDPLGMSADWFQNELTGDIYYNSKMRKGDEGTGAMIGKGWAHMGENGMFGTNDFMVIETNKNLANGFKTTGPDYTTETFFKGANAKTLMKGEGFDFLPTQQIRYESNLTYGIAQNGRQDLSITVGEKVFITEKSGYFETGSVEKSINPIGKGLIQGGIALKTVNRYQINYSKNKALVGLTKFDSYMQLVYGNRDTRWSQYYDNSSNKYPGNNQLINEFILRNR